jgi:cell division protease FtsH
MTEKERRSTAIHEAGHATIMWRLKNCDPVLKITIIPRGRSLGATWYLPEERVNHNVEHFMHKLAGLLGGRIAEQMLLDVTSTGAINDLERTTKTAYAMVAYYGMSPKVGNISFYDATGQRDMFTKPFSEQTAVTIDEEVRRIVEEAVALTREIIEAERENIERLADLLLEKETIFSEDVESILGKSAQQIEKELTEAEPKSENEPKTEGETITADEGEITYVIEPSTTNEETSKTE